jgi:THO complex subunit 6
MDCLIVHSSSFSLLVFCSTAGEKIKVWKMKDIADQGGQNISPVAELNNSNHSGVLRLNYSEILETLFAAYEDGRVCGWDLTTGKDKMSFVAHKTSTYCLCQRPDTSFLATGGGDGCVKVWDARNTASPAMSTVIGKSAWISCLDIDSGGNWMVCGGNFKPTLHHMSTLTKSATLSLGGTTYSARFYEDRLITGGSSSSLYHWSPNGTRLLKVPCSSRSILSLSVLPLPGNSQQILSVSGDCTSVDIFTNYGYKAFSLETE